MPTPRTVAPPGALSAGLETRDATVAGAGVGRGIGQRGGGREGQKGREVQGQDSRCWWGPCGQQPMRRRYWISAQAGAFAVDQVLKLHSHPPGPRANPSPPGYKEEGSRQSAVLLGAR